MSRDKTIHNLQTAIGQTVAVSLGLKHFSTKIIRHVINGGKLDDASLMMIKHNCIHDFKDTDVSGMPIDQEAEALNKALLQLEKFIDAAIRDGVS